MEPISRRNAIKAGVAGGGLLWAAPAIRTAAAHAAPGSPAPGTGTIQGQVTDATTGSPIAGATVTLDGGTTVATDPNGFYSFPGVSSGNHSVSAGAAGYSPQTTTVNVPGGGTATENFGLVPISNSVSVVLSWGTAPRDLDLHMSGPDPDGPGGRFHVAYYNQNPNDYVHQDVDDIDGNGPETDTVTISTSNGGTFVPGDYHIWVHNYSHTHYPGPPGDQGQNFAGSGGKIVLNGTAGVVGTWLVSGAAGDPNVDIWRVADFTLDAAGNITPGTVHQTLQPGNENTIL
jgi:hypothetical protein